MASNAGIRHAMGSVISTQTLRSVQSARGLRLSVKQGCEGTAVSRITGDESGQKGAANLHADAAVGCVQTRAGDCYWGRVGLRSDA